MKILMKTKTTKQMKLKYRRCILFCLPLQGRHTAKSRSLTPGQQNERGRTARRNIKNDWRKFKYFTIIKNNKPSCGKSITIIDHTLTLQRTPLNKTSRSTAHEKTRPTGVNVRRTCSLFENKSHANVRKPFFNNFVLHFCFGFM